jgi:hypothetical protein
MIKKALLVGINYTGTPNELNGCINDIKNVNSFLTTNCKFSNENIKLLSDDENIIELKPTRFNIENNIKWLTTNILPGDILVFHYSGHGGNTIDRNRDETDGKDETLIPLDYETAGEITDDWLFDNLISKIPKDVSLYCFLDCCHSGTAVDLKHNFQSNCRYKKGIIPKVYIKEDWTDAFSYSLERSREISGLGNICLFSGCQDKETSADAYINRSSQGAFTFSLLETLKTNLQQDSLRYKNGTLKLRTILKEINCRLDCHGFSQNTQISLNKRENFDTTLNL